MTDLFNLVIKSAFMDNMIFAYFLGMCSFLAVSKKVSTANGLGLAVIFVLTCTAPLNWLIQKNILEEGSLVWISPQFKNMNKYDQNKILLSRPFKLIAIDTAVIYQLSHKCLF